jgi:hypothetical protein
MRLQFAVGIASLLLETSPLLAQTAVVVPADVETAISSGYWELNDSTRGHYRIVIRTGGFEHIVSEAQVDWIADPTDSDAEAQVFATAAIPRVAMAGVHLINPVLEREGKQWILTIDADNTHCDPDRIDRWRVALGAPGKLTVLGSTLVQAGCE